ncbi:MAG: hypothetical protein IKS45_10650, partial [Thermoguttaceae bacterium]|nr:hypothetical protein [Thermoguttaceae bacterium]
MFQRKVWASVTALCVCSLALCFSQASAQDKVLKQYYGNGVHAYYSGDFKAAYDLLSKPIDAKIEDPRPYYFRGFALMELGRPEQAEKDFKAGAELELKDTTGRFPVNFALERCQGKARIALENARNEVQLAAFKRRAQYSDTIYNSRLEDQKATLIPEDLDLSGSSLDIEDGDSLIDNDADNGASPLDADDTLADQPADDDNNDLFGGNDDDAADKPADNDDVFGDDTDDAADKPAANDDVFGDDTDDAADKPAANDDVFGDDADDEPAVKDDDSDPFGAADDDASPLDADDDASPLDADDAAD